MSQFKAEHQQSGDDTLIKIQGSVDEDATFTALNLGQANRVILEMDGISAINSCGIREWIKWIRTATPSAKIVYRNCPKVIVDQINMVAGFLPENGHVESFYVPYYSEASGNEKMILFKEGVEFKGNEVFAPQNIKDDDGEEMEMDVIESKYFKFLQK